MNIVFNIVKSKNLKMNMTYEQFVIHASDLRNHSCSIDDDWNLQEYRNPMNGSVLKYLTKRKIQKMNTSSVDFECPDYACPVVCEYQVLYNPSYSCPDMYFNMWHNDGKLLSLEEVWSMVHCSFKQDLVRDKWNAITQEEHPYCNKPFFRIHPCKNTHIMKMFGSSTNKHFSFNPIITWLSTVGSLIGLELHLSYGHRNS